MRQDREPPPLTGPSDLAAFARGFEPYSFLTQIWFVADAEHSDTPLGRMYPGPKATANVFTPWGLAHLARYALEHGSPGARPGGSAGDVVNGVNIVNGLVDPLPPNDTRELRDWGVFLMRLGNKQFAFQTGLRQRLARMLTLFIDLPPQVPQAAAYDPARRFNEVTGVTIDQFVWTCFLFHIAAAKGPIVDAEAVGRHELEPLRDMVTPETVAKVIPLVSCTRKDFIERVQRETAGMVDERHDHFAFNPLYAAPLIAMPESTKQFVVPVPRLILERILEAPYYLLLEADGDRFTGPFGYVFEAYVGWLLKPHLADRLHPELSYGKNSKSSDWIVNDAAGAALLECKTGRLNKAVKTVAPIEAVADAVTTHYGKAVRQLHRVVTESAANTPGLELLADRELAPLIVLLDPVYLANSPLWEPFRARAKATYGVPPDFDPQICSVTALERLAPTLAGTELVSVIRNKVNDLDKRFWDWETFVPSLAPNENPALKERFVKFMTPLGGLSDEDADN